MASIKIIYPDGREETHELITAYHLANGTDFFAVASPEVDNGNRVFWLSQRLAGEERFHNFTNDEWPIARDTLIADIHNKKESFEYKIIDENVLVTEDWKKRLALRDENRVDLEKHYKEFKNAHDIVNSTPSQEVAPRVLETVVPSREPIPTPTPEPIEQPTIAPIGEPNHVLPSEPTIPPLQPEPTPNPTIAPSIEPTPIVDNNIVEFPTAQNMNVTVDNPQSVVTPVISEEPVNNGIFASTPSMSNQTNIEFGNAVNSNGQVLQQASESSVVKYYEDTINALRSELKDVTDNFKDITNKYKELTDKLLATSEKVSSIVDEIGNKAVGILSEVSERDKLSIINFEKSQQILASQSNDEMTKNLTKAA